MKCKTTTQKPECSQWWAAATAPPATPDDLLSASVLVLTDKERAMLDGQEGEAAAVAMRILARAGAIDGLRVVVCGWWVRLSDWLRAHVCS